VQVIWTVTSIWILAEAPPILASNPFREQDAYTAGLHVHVHEIVHVLYPTVFWFQVILIACEDVVTMIPVVLAELWTTTVSCAHCRLHQRHLRGFGFVHGYAAAVEQFSRALAAYVVKVSQELRQRLALVCRFAESVSYLEEQLQVSLGQSSWPWKELDALLLVLWQ
jgi:hypothetical protein